MLREHGAGDYLKKAAVVSCKKCDLLPTFFCAAAGCEQHISPLAGTVAERAYIHVCMWL